MTPSRTASERPAFAIMNGETIPFDEAKISIMAPGLTFAVTVFEGMRAYWNAKEEQLYVFRLDDHLARQDFSMKLIELDSPPSAEDTRKQIIEVLRVNKLREDCYIRTQAFIDDWGDMIATEPTSSSVICRARPRIDAFDTAQGRAVL